MDMSQIADRLKAKFGLGTRPDLRERLYEELEEMVYTADPAKADAVYQVLAGVASDAEGKSDPGRYFAHVVKLRLQERGLLAARMGF